MPDELKELIELFETERWLLIDGSMNEETVDFWREKTAAYPELKKMLEEAKNVENNFSNAFEEKPNEKTFEDIMKQIERRPSAEREEKSFFDVFSLSNFTGFKPAFALFIAALVISFYFFVKIERKYEHAEEAMFTWNGLELNYDIGKLKTKMVFAKDDKAKEFFLRYIYSDVWDGKVMTMQEDIKRLKTKILNSKL